MNWPWQDYEWVKCPPDNRRVRVHKNLDQAFKYHFKENSIKVQASAESKLEQLSDISGSLDVQVTNKIKDSMQDMSEISKLFKNQFLELYASYQNDPCNLSVRFYSDVTLSHSKQQKLLLAYQFASKALDIVLKSGTSSAVSEALAETSRIINEISPPSFSRRNIDDWRQ